MLAALFCASAMRSVVTGAYAGTGNRAVVAHAGGALHLLEKHRHRARVEAGGVERLQADAIGLALEVAE